MWCVKNSLKTCRIKKYFNCHTHSWNIRKHYCQRTKKSVAGIIMIEYLVIQIMIISTCILSELKVRVLRSRKQLWASHNSHSHQVSTCPLMCAHVNYKIPDTSRSRTANPSLSSRLHHFSFCKFISLPQSQKSITDVLYLFAVAVVRINILKIWPEL